MSMTDLRTAPAIPAGWYPDPVDPEGFRWWSGDNWTEHTSAPQPAAPEEWVAQPASPEPAAGPWEPGTTSPEVARFSRDPLVTGQAASVSAATMDVMHRKDPYRERNFLSGAALAVALLGLFAFVAGQLFDLPDVVLYFFGGIPFGVAAFAVVVSIRMGRGLAVAVIAGVLCLVNMTMATALSASEARDDIDAAIASSPTFEELVEESVISTTNTLEMPALATTADCPTMSEAPAIGTVFDCIVTLENGDSYLVHVTSKDGIGSMAMELIDEPLGS